MKFLPLFALITPVLTAVASSGVMSSDIMKGATTRCDSISRALDYQIVNYPASQYRDIYKNFMQDYFGPGHILADTAASAKYLRYELANTDSFGGPSYEPTGFNGNFYRVNLSLLRDGTIPYDSFFQSFVESVQGIVPPTGDEWMRTWTYIDSIICNKDMHFIDEEADRQYLNAQFTEGNYIAHHSRRYNQAVNFHYRIISRDNFLNHILPYIENKCGVK